MTDSAPRFRTPTAETTLTTERLTWMAEAYLMAGDIARLSPRTIATRRDTLHKLAWWLERQHLDVCDTHELRQFLAYVQHGHRDPEGRWGNPQNRQPVSARTVKDYHGILRAFCNWLVAEGELTHNPMQRVQPPIARPDQIQPFTPEETRAIVAAAARTHNHHRDLAIVLILLDTGLRASELCNLNIASVELTARRAYVTGKGDKGRTVVFSTRTARAIMNCLRHNHGREPATLLQGTRGPITRSGLRQITVAIGNAAGVRHAHPHRFRHTFAVSFLRSGGNVFTLQALLGHTHLQMTQRYVQFAQADVEQAGRRHSPVDMLIGNTTRR